MLSVRMSADQLSGIVKCLQISQLWQNREQLSAVIES